MSAALGHRIRELREEAGLTLEKLAYETDLGSKGYLSDIEQGLALPSLTKLAVLADGLGCELFDLLVRPESNDRHALVDATRGMPVARIRKFLKDTRAA